MSNPIIEIRRGQVGDQEALNDVMQTASLAVESGEVLRQLQAEPAYLTLDKGLLERGQVIVACADSVPVGFASFLVEGSDEAELDGMFIRPQFWRQGLGRQLFAAVESELVSRKATSIRVVAGMCAVDFYNAMGLEIVGEAETALGPVVPVMRKVFQKTALEKTEKGVQARRT